MVKPSHTVGYVWSVMTRSGLAQYDFLICVTDRLITDRCFKEAVSFLDFYIIATVGFI